MSHDNYPYLCDLKITTYQIPISKYIQHFIFDLWTKNFI